jgi:hypothetical protein
MKLLIAAAASALVLGLLSGVAVADSPGAMNQPPAANAMAAQPAPAPAPAPAAATSTGDTDLPSVGLSADDVAKWLQDAGYKATIKTNDDGSLSVNSATDGTNFSVDMYDCHDKATCTAIQFSVGFDTKGAWTAAKMNDYNSSKRWVRAYVDDKNDPWLEQDVDLIPGGTWEGLNDQFAVWRQMLGDFEKYINW